jgi:adenylosuccinate lyase
MHEVIREHSLTAWAALQDGEANPLIGALCADARILQYVPADEARALLDADAYVGDAPARARAIANSALFSAGSA